MADKNKDTQDRRRLRRFPAAQLEAWVKLRPGLIGQWYPVQAFDFTRAGLSVRLQEELTVDTKLMVRLRMGLDMGNIAADRLVTRVRNVRKLADGAYMHGLEFDFKANRHMRSIQTQSQLGRMEGILDRSEKLRKRLMTQEELLQELS
ncbi:hypothetical protein QQM79_09330 [Marinobacteraceae bacterium S3BR75-40.1]